MDLRKVQGIHSTFMIYRGNMKNIWEEYNYLNNCVRNAKNESFPLPSLAAKNVNMKTPKDAGGMQSKFLSGENTKKHFIDAVSLFEDYISSLATVVYSDYPQKMKSAGMSDEKALDVILNNITREEMIHYLAEEKVRSIFYGKPVDVFLKDKCQLELGDCFLTQYKDAINLYGEITGRRNVLIHNSGRIDNKYLRENPNTKFIEKQKIIISQEYLCGTIALLIGIAAKTTECIVKNIYKGDIRGKLNTSIATFERCYANEWYKNLLK